MNQQQLVSCLGLAELVMVLVAQPVRADVVKVTAVELNPTSEGIELILRTTGSKPLQVFTSSYDKTFVANVVNTQLQLPNGNSFRQENPIEGIAAVNITSINANSIRIVVTGEAELPKIQVQESDRGLVVSLTAPAETTATQTTPASETVEPESETQPEITPEEDDATQEEPAETEQPESGETSGEEDIEILVTGEQDTGYSVPDATTGTRTDTPIRDIPASIQVVPQEVIRDQQVTRFDEALRNVSGVIYGGTDTTSEVRFSIRGFENAPVLIDGFRQFGLPEFPDPAGLERIEVLKGPASILYGEIQPGGVINAVTKKPLTEPFYEAELQIGSRDFFRPRLDFSGPLTSDGRLLYRLNALVSTDDGFQDFDENYQNVFVAPVLTWQLGDRTDFTVELQYQEREKPFDLDDTVALGRGVADIPRDRIITEPDDDSIRKFLNVGYTLEHRFSDDWLIRNAFRYTRNSYFSDKLTIPFSFDETTGVLTRVYALDDFESQDYSLQTYLVGNFATGSIEHTLLFGVDLNHSNTRSIANSDFSAGITFLNIFDPVYDPLPRPPLTSLLFNTRVETNRLGVYLQDQIAFSDNLKLLLGLRYDTLKQETTTEEGIFTPTGDDSTQTPDALTPRVGIVYQPIQPISLYASYSQSFNPSDGAFDASGNLLEPEKGEGFEVGIKAELIGDRLSATLAYFDITKQNVATADPRFPLGGLSVATGEQQSRGVELDLSGEILPGWNIIASYAYTDAEVTEDNVTPIGNRLVGIPEHSFNVWTTYTIQTGSLQGLGFGVGVNYVGEREGDLDSSFQLPSYFLTDAAIFYQRDNWRFAVNFKNLFNEKYYPGAPFSRTAGVAVGEPFTVIGSVSVQF